MPTKTKVASTSLAVASGKKEIAERNSHALVAIGNASTAARIAAFEEMLATPYISGRSAAANEAIVTVLRVADGEIADMADPNIMHPQYLYLCKLQNVLSYVDTAGNIHEHFAGDKVILGLRKNKVRDMFATIVRDATNDGEVVPNLLVSTVPSKKPGWAPAVIFTQLEAEPGA